MTDKKKLWRPSQAIMLIGLPLLSSCAFSQNTQDTTRTIKSPVQAIMTDPSGEPLSSASTGAFQSKTYKHPENRGPGHQIYYNLSVQYNESQLYNPLTNLPDTVKLRSLVGSKSNEKTPFVGPKVDLWPGETFRLTLDNNLPDDESCYSHTGGVDDPHCFNGTNMHTHGLWISPTGNSDNVLLKIDPGASFEYEYNIPFDHPAGTFWYHPHLHGSTALQVSSGMSGPLIIHGDRVPRFENNTLKAGDIDTLLTDSNETPLKERVLMFEQIAYACRNQEGNIETDANGQWKCKPGQVGQIEKYDQFGPGTWQNSKRYTSINGTVLPTIKDIAVGDVERWRFIHAGVRDTIGLQFKKAKLNNLNLSKVYKEFNKAKNADEKNEIVEKYCSGAPLNQYIIASDGLTRKQVSTQYKTVFQPGYREDVLMTFPEKGLYCMVDTHTNGLDTINKEKSSDQILALIDVNKAIQQTQPLPTNDKCQMAPNAIQVSNTKLSKSDKKVLAKQNETICSTLLTGAQKYSQEKVRTHVVDDIKNGLMLTAFVPHKDVSDSEVRGQQEQTLGFNILRSSGGNAFHIGNLDLNTTTYHRDLDTGEITPDKDGNTVIAPYGIVNGKAYAADVVDRKLPLGKAQEWKLGSVYEGHPFHIHVNPFQIVSIQDEHGKEVTGDPKSQYYGYKGVWRDTIFVRQGYLITMRTRYERYIGEFVLHCHILDHEDQGMMENVGIYLTNGKGQIVTDAHH
ncbi:multicopper oxidase family protein [Vibrio nitrifigilis]|nr:multicopper oxidase domain-containing protein [Vibrio nitrifigilis]